MHVDVPTMWLDLFDNTETIGDLPVGMLCNEQTAKAWILRTYSPSSL